MPSQIRLDHLERVAERKTVYPAWRVTVYDFRTGLPTMTYFTCGKCSLKEKDCPTMKPERRDQDVPPYAYCAYCEKPARPWAP